jgi:peptide/nickel transport system permease protein
MLSILLPLAATHDPLRIAIEERLASPSVAHWFGTDELGRDLFSRIAFGIALTVSVSVAAMFSSLAIGVALGATAGYFYGRWPDRLFGWCADFLVSIPFLLVMAAVLSISGPGLGKAYAVLTAVMWVNPARIVRAEVIRTLPLDYVKAARALGFPEWKILAFTVIPACIDSAILFSISYLPEIIALEAGLSFLGLGVQPPQPGLGKIIFDGINYIGSAWWMALFPAASLFAIVLAVQLIMLLTRTKANGPR